MIHGSNKVQTKYVGVAKHLDTTDSCCEMHEGHRQVSELSVTAALARVIS